MASKIQSMMMIDFFANFFEQALREELNSLVRSAKRACISLTLGSSGCRKSLWADWEPDEKCGFERSVGSLTFQ